jgi:hypothetical protein
MRWPNVQRLYAKVPAACLLALAGIVTLGAGPAASGPVPAAAPAPTATPVLSKYQRQHLEAMQNSAPADRYFGKLKMSYLGINNTLRDSAILAGDHTTDAAIVNKISFAEDSLQDWESHFPRDPQLARTYYLAILAENKIWVQPNQERAWAYMNRLLKVFPGTYFSKQIQRDFTRGGFTEHYSTNPQVCATDSPSPEPTVTPTPTPVPTATPAPRRGLFGRAPVATPTPLPTPKITPTPVPTPSATPSPMQTQLAKGLSAVISYAPCVPPTIPLTPSPSPTATPSATPSPQPSTSPK